MLMMGTGVLFNSAKMLKMGVYVVFMHDYGHQDPERYYTTGLPLISASYHCLQLRKGSWKRIFRSSRRCFCKKPAVLAALISKRFGYLLGR